MIKGVDKRAIRYVPESERTSTEMQTAVWIKPKDGHDQNLTASRYARAERAGRRGRRELDVESMDVADVEEFCAIVEKWEWFQFPPQFPELASQVNKGPDGQELPPGVFPEVTDKAMLAKIAICITPDLSMELFEVANDQIKLAAGEKKTRANNVLQPLEKRKEGSE